MDREMRAIDNQTRDNRLLNKYLTILRNSDPLNERWRKAEERFLQIYERNPKRYVSLLIEYYQIGVNHECN